LGFSCGLSVPLVSWPGSSERAALAAKKACRADERAFWFLPRSAPSSAL
jgi:hypothetical protein